MNRYDSMMLCELFNELDRLEIKRKDIKRYHDYPKHMTQQEALQEVEEQVEYVKMKIEELNIIQSDYFDEEF